MNAASGDVVQTFRRHRGAAMAVAVRGNLVVSGGYDKTVRVWDLRRGGEEALCTMRQHSGAVFALAAEKELLVTGSASSAVHVFHFQGR